MNLILRFLRVVIHAFWRPKVSFLQVTSTFFHVWPNDIDFNFHLTNSRYLSAMDLGRVDLLIRTGLAKRLWRLKWKPVLGGAALRFRRSLTVGGRYEVRTQIVGWDHKWLYILQQFKQDDTLIAEGVVRALFVARGRSVPTDRLFRLCGIDAPAENRGAVLQAFESFDLCMGKGR